MYVTDIYHQVTLLPYQVGDFAWLSSADYECIIVCIDLVLPMGWVVSPKFFCVFSETLADVVNTTINTPLPVAR